LIHLKNIASKRYLIRFICNMDKSSDQEMSIQGGTANRKNLLVKA
jgi:hypothetical protein